MLTRLLPAEASALQVVLYSLLALATSLVTGLTCGLINGLLIAVVGITPILATLGTMELFTGIAIVITKGAAVFGFPELITFMGNGSLWIFPVPFLIFVVAAAVFAIILNKTAFGAKLQLLGKPVAARFSGLNTKPFCKPMLAGSWPLFPIVVLARTNSAKADYGSSYTLKRCSCRPRRGQSGGRFWRAGGLVQPF